MLRSLYHSPLPYDCLTFPLKLLNSLYFPSSTFNAELMRSCISISSSLIVSLTSFLTKRRPDESYNWGYERFASILSCVPATMFLISGTENLVFPFIYGIAHSEIPHSAVLSAGLGFSLLADFVRAKNCGGVLSTGHLLGSGTAAMVGILMYTPYWQIADVLGQTMSGMLQIFLGYEIINENIGILAGKSIGVQELAMIKNTLLEIPGVLLVDEMKTKPIGKGKYELVANVVFSRRDVQKIVMGRMRKHIGIVAKDKEDEKEIEKICKKSTDLALNKAAEIVIEAENKIKKEFPKISHIQIVGEFK
jgi:divalent metal cation (Fe/Co/Zn/Cd) transporter